MNDSNNKILTIVLIILSGIILYFVFTGNGKLNEAIKTIKNVEGKLVVVKDSLQKAQKSIHGVLDKIEFTENEMKIIKTERDLLEAEQQKKKVKNWEELNAIKGEIKKIEEKKDSLKQLAEKFEL